MNRRTKEDYKGGSIREIVKKVLHNAHSLPKVFSIIILRKIKVVDGQPEETTRKT
jgi:hypothetical protein